jgi:hypothetical protein
MSTHFTEPHSSRRGFLAGAAAGSAVLLANAAMATPSHAVRYANKLKFSASGQVLNGFNDVISNLLPPGCSPPPEVAIWVDMSLQAKADAVDLHIYLGTPSSIVQNISRFEIGVEDVKLADTFDPLSGDRWTNFGMLGAVTRWDYSPFPNFLGYPAAIGGRYRNWDGKFDLLAGNVFGSHVTVVRFATGEFLAKVPYNAY